MFLQKSSFSPFPLVRIKRDFNSRRLNLSTRNSRRKGVRRHPLPLRHKERNGVVPRATTIELLIWRANARTLLNEALCGGLTVIGLSV